MHVGSLAAVLNCHSVAGCGAYLGTLSVWLHRVGAASLVGGAPGDNDQRTYSLPLPGGAVGSSEARGTGTSGYDTPLLLQANSVYHMYLTLNNNMDLSGDNDEVLLDPPRWGVMPAGGSYAYDANISGAQWAVCTTGQPTDPDGCTGIAVSPAISLFAQQGSW